MSFREFLNKSGGRKLVYCGSLTILSTILLYVGFGDFQMWSNLNIIILGVYVGGNIGAKLSARKMEK